MTDETQPLIEQDRTYDPTSDAGIDTEEAFEIYVQYVRDLLERPEVDVERTANLDACGICVTLAECTETERLPMLLQMDNIIPYSMYMAASPPESNTLFVVEPGFEVPASYRPDRPDVSYIKSLFRPTKGPEFNNGWAPLETNQPPSERSLRKLEKSDQYQLGMITYKGSGTYHITVRWLGSDTDS